MKETLDLTPVLYGSCIPVKGNQRSVVCDLEKNLIHFIPNDMYTILKDHRYKTVNDICKFYNNKYDDIINDYFIFLKDRGLIFFTKDPDLFPSISHDWYEHAAIANSIIDADNFSI